MIRYRILRIQSYQRRRIRNLIVRQRISRTFLLCAISAFFASLRLRVALQFLPQRRKERRDYAEKDLSLSNHRMLSRIATILILCACATAVFAQTPVDQDDVIRTETDVTNLPFT